MSGAAFVEGSLLASTFLLLIGTVLPLLVRWWRASLWIQATGLLATVVPALTILVGGTPGGAAWSSALDPRLGVDRLSAFFVVTIAVAGVPSIVYATRYLDAVPQRRALASLTGAFVAALLLVVAARGVSTFLAGWELMTLIPAVAMLVARADRPVRRATFSYLAITHLGGVGVWVCLLLLSSAGAIGNPAAAAAQGTAYTTTVTIAAIVGFGTKAGLMPMHSWLPHAHPVAPAHISALMSGVMIKVALYGLIRVLFEWMPAPAAWVGLTVLTLGALSAVGGVLYALFQHELKRLLAFHSIENVGIIALGLGASLLLRQAGATQWAAIAFGAALLHTLNHAVFKGLLFLGAGAMERSAHSHNIDHMGGLLRLMPWTGGAFLVGSMAIAGLPPLNGFASEWLTLQALLHTGYGSGPAIAGPLAAGALAATAGMAVLCFAKVSGLVLLGRPRGERVAAAMEVPAPMRLAMAFLALLCGALGLVPGLLLPGLAALRGPAPALDATMSLPGTGSLPTPVFGLVLIGGALLIWLVSRSPRAERAPAWVCGQEVEPTLNWTSSAFTKPLRLAFEPALQPVREIRVETAGGTVRAATYRGHVPHLFDTRIYRPLIRRALVYARQARRLQSGSLRGYALYLGATLLVVLTAARLGWLG